MTSPSCFWYIVIKSRTAETAVRPRIHLENIIEDLILQRLFHTAEGSAVRNAPSLFKAFTDPTISIAQHLEFATSTFPDGRCQVVVGFFVDKPNAAVSARLSDHAIVKTFVKTFLKAV